MKRIVILFAFVSTFIWGQEEVNVDLSNPNSAIYTHLYFLQNDSYEPEKAAATIYGFEGEEAIDEGEDEYPFLMEVWCGDIYEKEGLSGLKELAKDLKEQLSEEEGRRVSVHVVRKTYYKALNKLKSKVKNNPDLSEKLHDLIEREKEWQSDVNEMLDNMVKYDND